MATRKRCPVPMRDCKSCAWRMNVGVDKRVPRAVVTLGRFGLDAGLSEQMTRVEPTFRSASSGLMK